MSPSAVPYDISEIPRFAYVPGLGTWIAALVLCAGMLMLAQRFSRRRSAPSLPIGALAEEIETLRASSLEPRRQAIEASHLVRIGLKATGLADIEHCTPRELEERGNAGGGDLGAILTNLARLDESRFRGNIAADDIRTCLVTIVERLKALDASTRESAA